jgi:hypothetical protein
MVSAVPTAEPVTTRNGCVPAGTWSQTACTMLANPGVERARCGTSSGTSASDSVLARATKKRGPASQLGKRPAEEVSYLVPEVSPHRFGEPSELPGLRLLGRQDEDRPLAADEVG